MDFNRKQIGQKGEEIACRYLGQIGYKIIDKNVRIGRGEIDIICQRRAEFIIVEVKTRTNECYGIPEEAITAKKALKLAELAQLYLQINSLKNVSIRVDIIVVVLNLYYKKAKIRHLKNAIDDGKNDELDCNESTL